MKNPSRLVSSRSQTSRRWLPAVLTVGIFGAVLTMALTAVPAQVSRVLGVTSTAANSATIISVSPTKTVASVPSRFIGLSFETGNLCNIVGPWNTPVFEQLLKNLGPQLIRIGGNTADKAVWDPSGKFSCSSAKTVLTTQLIDSFFAFAYRVNAKVLWNLNLGNYAPTTYGKEAAYIIDKAKSVGGSSGSFLWGMGIGNEPDLYIGNGMKPSSYSVTNYLSEWVNYKNSIRQLAQQPNFRFMANDNCCNDKWFNGLIGQERDSLSLVTHHYYPTRSNESGARAATVENLLSKSLMDSTTRDYVDKWVATAQNVPVAINETNSTAGGGQKGLSDTFASSLWAVDYMFTLMEHGVKNVNFHTGTSPSIYSPMTNYQNNTWIARPLYYALLLVRYAAPDGYVVSTMVQSPYNVVAHSIVDGKGVLRVVIINKDLHNTTAVKVQVGDTYKTAKYLPMTAPSVTATTGVVLGDSSVNADGTWKANTMPLTISQGNATMSLAPASAVVIVFQK